ncbi:unnamed protein product [Amoebophrya sp. A25]|nr:unnamed protein product [Amoebophrya sp. A25]|eukprot:GSA25T00026605001.1
MSRVRENHYNEAESNTAAYINAIANCPAEALRTTSLESAPSRSMTYSPRAPTPSNNPSKRSKAGGTPGGNGHHNSNMYHSAPTRNAEESALDVDLPREDKETSTTTGQDERKDWERQLEVEHGRVPIPSPSRTTPPVLRTWHGGSLSPADREEQTPLLSPNLTSFPDHDDSRSGRGIAVPACSENAGTDLPTHQHKESDNLALWGFGLHGKTENSRAGGVIP